MSSGNYFVRVDGRDGARVQMRFVVTGNGGFSGEPRPGGRALILLAAVEADPTVFEHEAAWSPLFRRLVEDVAKRATLGDRYLQVWEMLRDAAWMETNIDEYLASVTVTRARMLAGDWEDERGFDAWIRERSNGDDDAFRSLCWQWAPYFECVAEFTDPAYAIHLSPGLEVGTAAFASWRECPSEKLRDAPRTALDIFEVDSTGEPHQAQRDRR